MGKEKNSCKKSIMAIIIVLLILGVAIVTGMLMRKGYSLLSDVDEKDVGINISKINVELEEDTEWQENTDEYGISKYQKVVRGKSTEDIDAYVRIRCIPVVEYYDETANSGAGKWITAPVAQEDITLTISSDNWVQSGDYWYYKNILEGKASTEDLNIAWTVDTISSELASKRIRTDVKVILEYAQSKNNVWKEVFKINNLPAGVEAED